MLMSSVVVNVHMFGQEGEKKGQWELSKRTKNGAVDSEHGARKGRGLQHHTVRVTIPSFLLNKRVL
jgi:hypothetical protein